MAEEAEGQDTGAEAFVLVERANMTPFNQTTKLTKAIRKAVALLFLVAIALVPFLIVATYSREGGIWVLGYVTGIVTVPVVGIAAVHAMNTLSDERAFIGTVVFGFIVILISVAAGFFALAQ